AINDRQCRETRWRVAPKADQPEAGQQQDHHPEAINAGASFRPRCASVQAECPNPQATFNDESSYSGIPETKTKTQINSRHQGHIRSVSGKIQDPVADDGGEKYPGSTNVFAEEKIHTAEQPTPNGIHYETVTKGNVDEV